MKIGLVLDDSLDKTDGVQQYVLAIGQWFAAQGHAVHYLVGETTRTDIPNVHSLSRNLHVRFNQNRMSMPLLADGRQLNQLIATERFDVLHVQMPYSPFLAARIIRRASAETAVIGTFHILPYSWVERLGTRLLGWFLWRNLRRFDDVIAVSAPAGRFAEQYFRSQSQVVPNAVNTAVFAKGRRRKDCDDGKIHVVFLGRLVERKGAKALLEVVSYLQQKDLLQNVRFIMCGKGPLDAELKQYVVDSQLGQYVQFVGFVSEDDKPDYLASADIAVYPSLGGESFGIVLVEAMAAGSSVVIGGDNPGYRSILGEHPEQLVNPSDTIPFAMTLKHYIDSSEARQRAAAWQQRAVHQYDTMVVGGKLLGIYAKAIAKRSAKPDNTTNA